MNDVRRDLRSFYDHEAAAETRGAPSGFRVDMCREFAAQLASDGGASVVDIGAGPGTDAVLFVEAGVGYTGIDLSPVNGQLAARRGHLVIAASLFDLPFPDAKFDAVWSMSTLMHVPVLEMPDALREMARVVRPGATMGIGLWGGSLGDITGEGRDGTDHRRLFSLREADENRQLLAAHGAVEHFEVRDAGPDGWEYQFAVIRVDR